MTWAPHGPAAACMALGAALLVSCAAPQSAGTRDYDSASRLRVAAVAEASGQADVALSMYASAAAAEPGNTDVQARYAAALARSGNLAQAEQVLDRAIGRRNEDPALLTQLGRLRLRSGAAAEALAVFDRLLVAAPRNADALGGRGVALDLLGRHAEAERSHRMALALALDSLAVGNNLGMSLLLAGKPAEAMAVLEPLALRPGAPPRIAANLAIARAATGNRDAAGLAFSQPGGTEDLDAILGSLRNGS